MVENFLQFDVSKDFERANFYGWDFTWFAVDSNDCIAQFTTGFGAMPKKIFDSRQDYERVLSYFENAQIIGSSTLSKLASEIQSQRNGNFSIHLKEAGKGIFVYDEENYGTIHKLYASPEIPMKLKSTDFFVQEYLKSFRVKELRFAETEEIDITETFLCE